jgi:hypothetical protein
MKPDEFRALLRTLGIRAIIEAVVDVILVVGLLVATVTAPGGIPKVMAAVAVGLIIVGWAFGRRRFLWRK